MTLPQHMLRSTAYDLAEALDVNELYQQKGWTGWLANRAAYGEMRYQMLAGGGGFVRRVPVGAWPRPSPTWLSGSSPGSPANGTLGEAGRPRAPAAGPPGALWRLSGTAQPPAWGDYLRAMPTAVPSHTANGW